MTNMDAQELSQEFRDERTRLTYTLVDDWYYLVSDEKALPEKEKPSLGKFGLLRQSYLRTHRKSVYQEFATSGTLQERLLNIDQTAHKQWELIIRQIAERESVDDVLKERDQLGWVAAINSICNRAEEIVLNNLVYS